MANVNVAIACNCYVFHDTMVLCYLKNYFLIIVVEHNNLLGIFVHC